jgi:nucleoid DNA-binding protein
MTKSEIVRQVSRATGVPRSRTQTILRELLDSIERALSEGEDVELRRFGSFRISERRRTSARHPRTGEVLTIPARIHPVFRPSRTLRDKVERSGAVGS